MKRRQSVLVPANILIVILAINLSSLRADDPHTFGHAAELRGYDSATTVFDLGGHAIESLDGVTNYPAAEGINLTGNRISTVSSGAFSGLSSLKTLYLYSNKISTVSSGAFSGLSSLQTLDLGYNEISTVSSGTFSGLSSLQTLDLRFNAISTVSSGTFSGLSSLQSLYLRDNEISTVSSGAFSGLSSLQTLNLRYNEIGTVSSDAFSDLSSLQTLDLRSNQMTHVNLSGATFIALTDFLVRSGNTIASVDLSDATLSQGAFDAIARDLRRGGVLSLDLSGADLALVTNYEELDDWVDLEVVDLSFATLGSDSIDYLTDHLAGLNDLTISQDQWDRFSGTIQTNLNTWDSFEGNSLSIVVPEPASLALVLSAVVSISGVRRRRR